MTPYMHACMHACMHTYIHSYIHTYIHTYTHTHIHTYLNTYTYVYIHAHPFPINTRFILDASASRVGYAADATRNRLDDGRRCALWEYNNTVLYYIERL